MIELVIQSRCIECDRCVRVCPTNVFDAVPGGAPVIAPTMVACFVVGLIWILSAGFAYTDATAFPGNAALLPVCGAALIVETVWSAMEAPGQYDMTHII